MMLNMLSNVSVSSQPREF